ncbi:hypothetical protein MMC24_005365 [Lignoscripta atroalba]|nr:hypothetical protein [Lignoscripta atroalba]
MSQTDLHRLEPGPYRDAFLVFCIAEISAQLLNHFLCQAYGQPDVQGGLCLLTSTDITTVTHSSHSPVSAFRTPFLGWTLSAINDYVEQNVPARNPLSEKFYVVLDDETVRSGGKSCLLVENVVERRRRYAAQGLSPTPDYEDEGEEVKSVRIGVDEALQMLSGLDERSLDMVELMD